MDGQKAETAQKSEAWRDNLDERQRRHVEFCEEYMRKFAHGAPGHLDYMVIGTMAIFLDNLQLRGHIFKAE